MDFKLVDLIYHVPGFLSKNDCLQLINFYEKNSYRSQHESSFDSSDKVQKVSLFKSLEIEENTKEYSTIFSATEKVINLYCQYLNRQKLFFHTFKNHFAYSRAQRLLKYEKGAYLHQHTDWGLFSQGSITFNLNDDYEGGDFSFFNGNYKVKLGCGDALIFPAGLHWLHGVDEIISGTRYSTNSFLQPSPHCFEKKVLKYMKEIMDDSILKQNRYNIIE
ncbi:MAG: hypothetical protein EBS34_11815 [Flavobacteriales bacterium]|nr:hypothetical protein [Flavobacteriales bacterium]